nr:hypothetical protein [Verrucomicrobium spinosum]
MRLPVLLSVLLLASQASAIDDYKIGDLALEKPGVPKGTLTQMPTWNSKVYAGTTRDWWVYAPAQYTPEKPAALMVFQDGHDYVNAKGNWRVPTVFDNLIASGAMPPTIGIFINPGHLALRSPRARGSPTTVARNTTPWATRIQSSCSMKSSPKCRSSTSWWMIQSSGPSAGPVAGPSAPSPSRGNGRTSSARSSPPLAAMWTWPVAMPTRT